MIFDPIGMLYCQERLRQEAKTIDEFIEKVRKSGDRKVVFSPYLLQENGATSFCILLEGKCLKYDRKIPTVRTLELEGMYSKEEEDLHYLILVKDLVFDMYDRGLNVALKPISYRKGRPKKMRNDDFTKFFEMAVLKERIKHLR